MKAAKAPRVPVLENAFEVNLPKLMRAVKATGSSRLVLDDGDVRTVAVLAETRLAVLLGGQQWVVDIVPVQCLEGRVRCLLKCPRAHEGNFQSLYFRGGELACRHCHHLRYRSTTGTKWARERLAVEKQIGLMGGADTAIVPARKPYRWRKRYLKHLAKLYALTNKTHNAIKSLSNTPRVQLKANEN
jgi:hypothetical protein